MKSSKEVLRLAAEAQALVTIIHQDWQEGKIPADFPASALVSSPYRDWLCHAAESSSTGDEQGITSVHAPQYVRERYLALERVVRAIGALLFLARTKLATCEPTEYVGERDTYILSPENKALLEHYSQLYSSLRKGVMELSPSLGDERLSALLSLLDDVQSKYDVYSAWPNLEVPILKYAFQSGTNEIRLIPGSWMMMVQHRQADTWHPIFELERDLGRALIIRLKILTNSIDIHNTCVLQEGMFQLKGLPECNELAGINFMLTTEPTHYGEMITIRNR